MRSSSEVWYHDHHNNKVKRSTIVSALSFNWINICETWERILLPAEYIYLKFKDNKNMRRRINISQEK